MKEIFVIFDTNLQLDVDQQTVHLDFFVSQVLFKACRVASMCMRSTIHHLNYLQILITRVRP